MIACHTWDTLGAAAAGWEAALISGRGRRFGLGPQPHIIGHDLSVVAASLMARYGGSIATPGAVIP